ncbi:MAG TPA: DUF4019 domain-containing protein [Pyrinomonadaceae bacterium]|nr:DUF4019 domain-containing protein [Pyrinomonadaceae bacterium]
MNQAAAVNEDLKSHGWEGWLARAYVERHSTSGGKPPFPTLSFFSSFSTFPAPSFSICFPWLLTALLILSASIFGSACATNKGAGSIPPEVESAISTLSDEIAAERYDKIYNEASELWRQTSSVEESTATFKTLRTKLGPVESRTLQSATEQQNSGGPLKGRAYIVNYRTKFHNGEGMETFTLVERDGRWLLARYFVNSTALK